MDWIIILLAAGTMLALALFMAYILGWANRAFHVEIDPKQEQVQEALPGANCGACGYVGCNEYAEAVAQGRAPVDKCPVGGAECANKIAEIMGVEVEESYPERPVVHCGASYDDRLKRHEYKGEQTCTAANLVAGVQGCAYGCLGFGDCEFSCDFDAIHVVNGLATVDYEKCVGCGACERACPRHIISMVPFKTHNMLVVKCSNHDFGKDVKAVCKVGCTGCKLCAKMADGLISMENNKPVIDYETYDPSSDEMMGKIDKAIHKCPMARLEKISGMPGQEISDDGDGAELVTDEFETTVDKTEWYG